MARARSLTKKVFTKLRIAEISNLSTDCLWDNLPQDIHDLLDLWPWEENHNHEDRVLRFGNAAKTGGLLAYMNGVPVGFSMGYDDDRTMVVLTADPAVAIMLYDKMVSWSEVTFDTIITPTGRHPIEKDFDIRDVLCKAPEITDPMYQAGYKKPDKKWASSVMVQEAKLAFSPLVGHEILPTDLLIQLRSEMVNEVQPIRLFALPRIGDFFACTWMSEPMEKILRLRPKMKDPEGYLAKVSADGGIWAIEDCVPIGFATATKFLESEPTITILTKKVACAELLYDTILRLAPRYDEAEPIEFKRLITPKGKFEIDGRPNFSKVIHKSYKVL